jgi:hypothetical protein
MMEVFYIYHTLVDNISTGRSGTKRKKFKMGKWERRNVGCPIIGG